MNARHLSFPPFRLDLDNEQLWEGEEPVPLRPKLFALLRYLAEHAGRLVSREELRAAVWSGTVVSESVLRGMIRELRELLGDAAAAARFVETVPSRGYRFLPPVTVAPAPSSKFRGPGFPAPPSSRFRSLALTVVGREQELRQLHEWLGKALTGERQLVFVTGEPGIGKTTLLDAFLQSLDATHWIARGQCIEHYGAGEAYLPVLDALGDLCRQPGGEHGITLLQQYAPTWLAQMPALLNDTELEALQRKVQGVTRERMLREMAEALEALTAEQPLVLVLEDLHWSDHSTLDLLALLAQRRGPARLLLLASYRPAEVVVSGHPLRTMKQELQARRQGAELPLGFLTTAEVSRYLTARFPQQQFLPELAHLLHQSTEGNPLFMVNVVDEWVRQEAFLETDGRWRLSAKIETLAASAPASLRQLIEKQVERLTPEEQRAVETAGVVGGEFTTAAVAAGCEESPERLEQLCEGLARREQLIRMRGTETLSDGTVTGRYGFLHALYPQVLYERLPTVRRIHLHRRIGEWAERAYGALGGEHAAELAMHFEQGQNYERAVRYLTQAGQNALLRFAHPEAIRLLTKGLELLMTLPETPARLQQELDLQCVLGATLVITKGYGAPEVQRAYERAFILSQQVKETRQLLRSLVGLCAFHFLRAELQPVKELTAQLFRLAQSTSDSTPLLWAHTMQGLNLAMLGELSDALKHLEAGIAMYDPQRHRPDRSQIIAQDPKVTSLAYAALTLWRLGYPDQARKRADETLALARELSHPFNLVIALDLAGAGVNLLLRDVMAVATYTEMLMKLAHEQSFPYWLARGVVRHGWVLAEQGQAETGIIMMRQGINAIQLTGAELSLSYILAHIAEAYGKVGQAEEGLSLLTEALARLEQTSERWWEAELWRLKGELLLQKWKVEKKVKDKKRK